MPSDACTLLTSDAVLDALHHLILDDGQERRRGREGGGRDYVMKRGRTWLGLIPTLAQQHAGAVVHVNPTW